MNFQSSLSYIMEQLPMYQRVGSVAYRSGLENTLKMDAHFKHPHTQFATIHIAGTNGKGSVSHMLASVLQEAGYKVGIYTSPHLIDFRERMKINGKMITKKYVTEFITTNRDFFSTFDPSFFEISVFMAFTWFAASKVDIAIIEVGLGGRLDATNIITPVLSVITNIGLDHTEILGDTLEKIAAEKAGIIKNNVPVIIGQTQAETLPVYKRISRERKADMIVADNIYRIDYSLKSVDDLQVFNVKKNGDIFYTNLKCGLLGHYQRKNTVTVLSAIDCLQSTEKIKLQIKPKDIFSGIRNVVINTGLLGRWQIVQSNPQVICDTAHNADGIKVVTQQVKEMNYKQLHMVVGFVNDKDITKILGFFPARAMYYFVRLSVPRTMDENTLASMANKAGLKGQAFANMPEAIQAFSKKASRNDLIVITGSNFLVADFLVSKEIIPKIK